jgi:hypothetical protein
MNMKQMKKTTAGVLAVLLVLGFILAGCDINGPDSPDKKEDPTVIQEDPTVSQEHTTVSQIEAAFTNMLKATFVSGSNVTVNAITKMSKWGQTDSEYGITKGQFEYELPSSFGTVPVIISGGTVVIISGGAVLMTYPYAKIVWGSPAGDTTYISGSDGVVNFPFPNGSGTKTVTYPYTVLFPAQGSTQFIKGKLNLIKW